MGHSFLCNKSLVLIPTWRSRSGEVVKVQYRVENKANEMRRLELKIPHKAQLINKNRRSYEIMGPHHMGQRLHFYVLDFPTKRDGYSEAPKYE